MRITIEQLVDILKNGNNDGLVTILSTHAEPGMLEIGNPTSSCAYSRIASTGQETVTLTITFTRAYESCNKDNKSEE